MSVCDNNDITINIFIVVSKRENHINPNVTPARSSEVEDNVRDSKDSSVEWATPIVSGRKRCKREGQKRERVAMVARP